MRQLKLEKADKKYRCQLDASEYDYLEVVQEPDERITIKFLDQRWRTVNETKAMLQEVINVLDTLPKF